MVSSLRSRNPFLPRARPHRLGVDGGRLEQVVGVAVADPGLRDMVMVLVAASHRTAKIIEVTNQLIEAAALCPLVLDTSSAATIVASGRMPRDGLIDAVLVTNSTADQHDYEVGLAARVQAVVAVPQQQDELVQWLQRPTSAAAGPVMTITAGSGGCGATALATICAHVAANAREVALVDAAWPRAGVIDRAGIAATEGIRLDALTKQLVPPEPQALRQESCLSSEAQNGQVFDPNALKAQLPQRKKLAVAGWSAPEAVASGLLSLTSLTEKSQRCRFVLTQVVDALRHSGAAVMVDEPLDHPSYCRTHAVLVATNTEWSLRQSLHRLRQGAGFTHAVVRCTPEGTVPPHVALDRLALPGALWRHDRHMVTPSPLAGPHAWSKATGKLAAHLVDLWLAPDPATGAR